MADTKLTPRYILFFLGVVIFTWFIHELAHWLTYTSMGYEALMSFNKVSILGESKPDEWQRMWASAAGPLITLVQGVMAYVFLHVKRWNKYVYVFLFAAFYMRALAGLMNLIQLNDEGRISVFLGLGTYTVPIVVSGLLFYMVYKISKKYQLNGKFHLAITLFTMLFSSILILSDQFLELRIL